MDSQPSAVVVVIVRVRIAVVVVPLVRAGRLNYCSADRPYPVVLFLTNRRKKKRDQETHRPGGGGGAIEAPFASVIRWIPFSLDIIRPLQVKRRRFSLGDLWRRRTRVGFNTKWGADKRSAPNGRTKLLDILHTYAPAVLGFFNLLAQHLPPQRPPDCCPCLGYTQPLGARGSSLHG